MATEKGYVPNWQKLITYSHFSPGSELLFPPEVSRRGAACWRIVLVHKVQSFFCDQKA
jgi:hypothetical protein